MNIIVIIIIIIIVKCELTRLNIEYNVFIFSIIFNVKYLLLLVL